MNSNAMKIIPNKIIPIKGFSALSFCGVLFVRDEFKERCLGPTATIYGRMAWDTMLRHEHIHLQQQRELLFIPFFVIYLVEWVARLFISPKTAYRDISFEREAFANEDDINYKRQHFAQWRSRNHK